MFSDFSRLMLSSVCSLNKISSHVRDVGGEKEEEREKEGGGEEARKGGLCAKGISPPPPGCPQTALLAPLPAQGPGTGQRQSTFSGLF